MNVTTAQCGACVPRSNECSNIKMNVTTARCGACVPRSNECSNIKWMLQRHDVEHVCQGATSVPISNECYNGTMWSMCAKEQGVFQYQMNVTTAQCGACVPRSNECSNIKMNVTTARCGACVPRSNECSNIKMNVTTHSVEHAHVCQEARSVPISKWMINDFLIPRQKTIETGQKTKNSFFFLTDDLVSLFSHDVSRQLCAPSSDGQSEKKKGNWPSQITKNKPWQWLSAKRYGKEIKNIQTVRENASKFRKMELSTS